jgi:hypothetical protein
MMLNRRGALAGAGGLMAALATGEAWAQNAPRVRRAASSLNPTDDDVLAFADGVRIMKRRSDALSWDAQNRLHAQRAEHGSWRFLPWHRLQVAHMERIIAAVTGHSRFAMPYWDWQVDRFLPPWIVDPTSLLYERERDPAAATLDFQKARFAQSRDVARVADDPFDAFCGRERAAGRVEAYGHNIIHMLVGGYMSSTRTAALDPVFWLHHCNVDRVWATWHQKQGDRVYPRPWKDMTMAGFTGPDGRQTGRWVASRITTTRGLGYQYDSLYAPLVFALPPGALGGAPVSGTVFPVRAEAGAADGSIRLDLPSEAVRLLRETPGRVTVQGEGVIAYERSENLTGRAIATSVTAGRGRVELGVSPTFVHFGGAAPEEQAEHAGHDAPADHGDYAHVFTFDSAVVELARRTTGPISIVSTAEDLRPEEARPPARAVSLEATVTVTVYAG